MALAPGLMVSSVILRFCPQKVGSVLVCRALALALAPLALVPAPALAPALWPLRSLAIALALALWPLLSLLLWLSLSLVSGRGSLFLPLLASISPPPLSARHPTPPRLLLLLLVQHASKPPHRMNLLHTHGRAPIIASWWTCAFDTFD